MIEEEIRQTIETLAEERDVEVIETERLHILMAYIIERDAIAYNIDELKSAYNKLRQYRHIDLSKSIRHIFGHELGHREKYRTFGVERALKIEEPLETLFYSPREAIRSLPKEERHLFPLYRASAIAFYLFEEYYAEKHNALKYTHYRIADTLLRFEIIKRNSEAIRKAIHVLHSVNHEAIRAYFIYPITHFPRHLKPLKIIFPEYPILLKIRKFCDKEIRTAEDVFDEEKMKKLAEIILYEL